MQYIKNFENREDTETEEVIRKLKNEVLDKSSTKQGLTE